MDRIRGLGTPHESEVMTMAYRRRTNSDTWHFCRNCSKWPTSDYVEQQSRPTTGELDNECLAKQQANTCSR